MSDSQAYIVMKTEISTAVNYCGRMFKGPYEDTPQFMEQLQKELIKAEVAYEAFNTLSIYPDDPAEKAPEQLQSFHGIKVKAPVSHNPELENRSLPVGHYLHYGTIEPGLIWFAFEVVHNQAQAEGIALADVPPLLVTTFINGQVQFNYYFPLKD